MNNVLDVRLERLKAVLQDQDPTAKQTSEAEDPVWCRVRKDGDRCQLLRGHSGDHKTTNLRFLVNGLDDEVEREEVSAAREMLEHEYDIRRWHEGIVPRRFRAAALDDVRQPTRIQERLRAWASADNPENLLLLGPVGTGKTFAAVAAARERSFAGWSNVVIRTAPELLASLRPDGGATVAVYMAADVLVIDDLGTERLTEWADEQLIQIVDARWRNQAPIIATSNLTAEALHSNVGDRIFDRLMDGTTVLPILGQSRRRGAA